MRLQSVLVAQVNFYLKMLCNNCHVIISKRMLSGILVIKCPANRGRFSKSADDEARWTFTKPPGLKGNLITNIPESMRLVCNNMVAEGKKQWIRCFYLARSLY